MELPPDPRAPTAIISLFPDGTFVLSGIRWSPRDRTGLSVLASLGAMSALSILSLLAYFLICSIRTCEGKRALVYQAVRAFVRTDLGALFINLLISDLIVSSSWIVSIRFVLDKETRAGLACSIQGGAYVVGIVAVGFWNCAIAFQTYMVLVLRWNVPRWIARVTIAFGWVMTIALVGIGPIAYRNRPYRYYGPTPVACFVTLGTPHSAMVWKAGPIVIMAYLLFTAVFYIAIAIHVGRVFSSNKSTAYKRCLPWMSQRQLPSSDAGRVDDAQRHDPPSPLDTHQTGLSTSDTTRLAAQFIWFPAVYGLATLPLAILTAYVAWNKQAKMPPIPVLQLGSGFAACVGMFDVLLFLYTRRALFVGSKYSEPVDDALSEGHPHRASHLPPSRRASQQPLSLGRRPPSISLSFVSSSGGRRSPAPTPTPSSVLDDAWDIPRRSSFMTAKEEYDIEQDEEKRAAQKHRHREQEEVTDPHEEIGRRSEAVAIGADRRGGDTRRPSRGHLRRQSFPPSASPSSSAAATRTTRSHSDRRGRERGVTLMLPESQARCFE